MMNISQPATTSSDISSITPENAASPISSAPNGPSLWRSILDTHGREILEFASDQFLDLATALRLETISGKDLVNLLTKAGRLSHREADVIDDDEVAPLVQAHNSGQPHLDANSAPTLRAERIGQDGGNSAPSPQASLVEVSRVPKRLKTNEHGSLGANGPGHTTRAQPTRVGPTPLEKQGSNGMKRRRRMQEQRLTSAMVGGNSGPGPGTKVAAPASRSVHVLKNLHTQRGVYPVPSSDAKEVSTQRIECIVITDTEPESSEDEN
jgi:hypothetical protein